MSSIEMAAWAAAIATFATAVVALFKEDLVSLWRKPELRMRRIRLSPPDCHKTEITVTHLQTGEVVDTWPCYWFRVWIENAGNVRANNVEVFARRLLRKHADGGFKEEPQFLPLNLKWSHTGEVVAPDISAKMGRFCDIGHVVHRDKTRAAGHALPSVAAGQTYILP